MPHRQGRTAFHTIPQLARNYFIPIRRRFSLGTVRLEWEDLSFIRDKDSPGVAWTILLQFAGRDDPSVLSPDRLKFPRLTIKPMQACRLWSMMIPMNLPSL